MAAPKGSEQSADDSKKVSAEMAADLVAAVDASVKSAEVEGGDAPAGQQDGDDGPAQAEDEAASEAPPSAPEQDDDKDDDKDDEPPATKPEGLSDEVIGRAAKAGIPYSEIKQYSNDALLDAMCARIEGASGDTGSQGGAGDQGGEAAPASVDDLLSAIPKLDPEVDESIASALNGMKEIIKRQSETIAGQGEAIASFQAGRSKDWFTAKLEGVKDLTKGDAAKAASVRAKFDVLRAGYKAVGKDVTDEAVFGEAANQVLGADMAAAKLEKQGRAAKKRSGQRISRPTNRREKAAKPDVYEETAAEIDRKFSP